jgi:AcrR family transcriptional regulator
MTDSQSTTYNGRTGRPPFTIQPGEIEALPRYERKKIQTRDRIYRAALELFAERGLAATTVDQITELADVGKGTFFNYFRSKEEVFGLFIQIQHAKLAEAAEEAKGRDKRLHGILHRLFKRLGEEMGCCPQLARAMVTAILGNEAARETVAAGMSEGRRMLAAILRRGQRRGEVRKDREAQAMSRAFQQALFGALVIWAVRPQDKLETLLDVSFEDYWKCATAIDVKKFELGKEGSHE